MTVWIRLLIGLSLSLLLGTLNAQEANGKNSDVISPQPKTEDPNCLFSSPPCGLPGIDYLEMYHATADAITDFNNGEYGFPAELIARAYGWDDLGAKLSRLPWVAGARGQSTRLTKRDFIRNLSVAKRRVQTPTDSPAFIAADIPGLGTRQYDARLVRQLINTELFPQRLSAFDVEVPSLKGTIKGTTKDTIKVPYVLLESEAAKFAKACLAALGDEAERGKNSCPARTNAAANRDFEIRQGGFSFTDSPRRVTPQSSGHPKLDQTIMPLKTSSGEVRIRPLLQCGTRDKVLDLIPPQEDDPDDGEARQPRRYCYYVFSIVFPETTSDNYDLVRLRGQLSDRYVTSCSPLGKRPGFPYKDRTEDACADGQPSETFGWKFDHKILIDGATQTLVLRLKQIDDSEVREPSVKIQLVGFHASWLLKIFLRPDIRCGCVGPACQKKAACPPPGT